MSLRPLHAIVEHKFDKRKVRHFFVSQSAGVFGFFIWASTAWRNTDTANNNEGAIMCAVFFGLIFVVLAIWSLWDLECRRTEEEKARSKRISQLEREDARLKAEVDRIRSTP